MKLKHTVNVLALFLGDVAALYAALFLTLYLRYGATWRLEVHNHIAPFTLIFATWLTVFYIAGLYDIRRLRNNLDFFKVLSLTLAVNAGIAIIFFYFIPIFGITPKTNLFGFMAVFGVIEFLWRRYFNRLVATVQPPRAMVLVGESAAAKELYEFIEAHPQLGLSVRAWIRESSPSQVLESSAGWRKILEEVSSNFAVVLKHFPENRKIARAVYELLAEGYEVQDFPSFYESVFRKVPLAEITDEWFLEQPIDGHKFYDNLKRAFEFLFSLALFIVLLPLLLCIAIFVKLTSKGSAIYSQVRVGEKGKSFTFYKFRSMRADAEKGGAQWKTSPYGDPRLTLIGKILVYTHLDELPQLINILKGELSFVGPRPERPEFVSMLEKEVPFYAIRHLIKPGITGWAQVNFPYGGSVAETREKLSYDIYYLKNRSIILDVAIVIKTVKALFAN